MLVVEGNRFFFSSAVFVHRVHEVVMKMEELAPLFKHFLGLEFCNSCVTLGHFYDSFRYTGTRSSNVNKKYKYE